MSEAADCHNGHEPYAGARAEVIPRFAVQLRAGGAPVVFGDGRQTRDFTYVDDTVAGLLAAGACDALVGDIVNVAFGSEVSILRIAELLTQLAGASERPVVHAAPRPGDVDRHCADIGKARGLFGFAPRVGIEEGLARTLAWIDENDIASRVEAGAAASPNW